MLYSAIAQLSATFGRDEPGTAAMLDRQHALTAAHCVYDYQKRTWAQSARLVFSQKGPTYHVTHAAVFAAYIQQAAARQQQSAHHDMAVLRLDRAVDCVQHVVLDVCNGSQRVSVAGFLGGQDEMQHAPGDTCEIAQESEFFYHYASTYSGQSGAPVVKDLDSTPMSCIGVHTGDGGPRQNIASRITPAKKAAIESVCHLWSVGKMPESPALMTSHSF